MSVVSLLISLLTQLNPVANGVLPVSVEQRPKVKIEVEFLGAVNLEPGAAVLFGSERVGYISTVTTEEVGGDKAGKSDSSVKAAKLKKVAKSTSVLVTFDAPKCVIAGAQGPIANPSCLNVVAIKSFDEVASVGRPEGVIKLLPTDQPNTTPAQTAKVRGFTSVEDYWRS